MKKIYTLLIIISIILLTGCSKNKLTCTVKEDGTNFEFESKYVFTFNGNNIKHAKMLATGKLLGDYNTEDSIANYQSTANTAAENYNKVEGITATVNVNKNSVTLTVEIDPAKLSDDAKTEYGVDLDKKDLQKQLEDLGYTCK